jgi:hypothetical protein
MLDIPVLGVWFLDSQSQNKNEYKKPFGPPLPFADFQRKHLSQQIAQDY